MCYESWGIDSLACHTNFVLSASNINIITNIFFMNSSYSTSVFSELYQITHGYKCSEIVLFIQSILLLLYNNNK